MNKLEFFFKELIGKEQTAGNIRDAYLKAGEMDADQISVVLSYAEAHGVNIKKDLLDLQNARDEFKSGKKLNETLKKISELSGAAADETDAEKKREMLHGVKREINSLDAADGLFKFIRADQMPDTPPDWLVEGMIETESFSCIFGKTGSYKSFLTMDLCASIATGRQFFNLPCKQGIVFYIAAEGKRGLKSRLDAWSLARGQSIKDAPIYFNDEPLLLNDDQAVNRLIKTLEIMIGQAGGLPSLIVLDTWARSIGGDESSTRDTAMAIAAGDKIKSNFGNMAILAVHHEGYLEGRARGSSAFKAALDSEFRMELGADGVIRLENTKSKDTALLEPMAFRPCIVEMGAANDKPLTSVVLNRVEYTPMASAIKKSPSVKQSIAMDVLEELTEGGKKATVKDWRVKCKEANLTPAQFRDCKAGLLIKGLITLDGVGDSACVRSCVRDESVINNTLSSLSSLSLTPMRNLTQSHAISQSHEKESVGNSSNPTPSNTSNAPELFQDGKP